MFDNKDGKHDQFSKFFHQVIRTKILYVHITTISAYLEKVKNPQMYLTLTALQHSVDVFL